MSKTFYKKNEGGGGGQMFPVIFPSIFFNRDFWSFVCKRSSKAPHTNKIFLPYKNTNIFKKYISKTGSYR
jgi:hypothetical protein